MVGNFGYVLFVSQYNSGVALISRKKFQFRFLRFNDLRAVRCCGVKLSVVISRLLSNLDNTEVT